jgi:hypothetical protein
MAALKRCATESPTGLRPADNPFGSAQGRRGRLSRMALIHSNEAGAPAISIFRWVADGGILGGVTWAIRPLGNLAN